MTEEEAKKRWCPMRPMGYDDDIKEFNCIASNCMMWRWSPNFSYADSDNGYCGLGGKP